MIYHFIGRFNVPESQVFGGSAQGLIRFTLMAVVFVIAVSVGCTFYNIQHDPRLAVRIASDFSEEAFVRQDFHSSFGLLNPNKAPDFTEDSLKEMIQGMHPTGVYPTSVTVVGYEIVP